MAYYSLYECRVCGMRFARGPQDYTEADVMDRLKAAVLDEVGHTAYPLVHDAEQPGKCLPGHLGALSFMGIYKGDEWPSGCKKVKEWKQR